MRRFVSYGPAFLVLFAVAIALFAGPAAVREYHTARIGAMVNAAQASLDQNTILDQINECTSAIADATLPGVVHVETRTRFSLEDEPSEEDRDSQRLPLIPASGAGWVYDQQGHIVTNAHVVAEAERVSVQLFDGRVRRAEVIGVDENTDIAVLKIDIDSGLFPLRRASNRPVRVGERAFAFGSPFGIRHSMSEGIVTGLGRSEASTFIGLIAGYTNFIQTDAAINPGNSGGPLVDSKGRVIGMVAAIANNLPPQGPTPVQGQSAGIAFAIPLETIEVVVAQLIERQVVIRGYLGIRLPPRNFDPEVARELGFEGAGTLVGGTRPGEPAAEAGIQAGDIIISIDGVPTPDQEVLRSLVSLRPPGTELSVHLWRNGEFLDTKVRIGAAYNESRSELRYVPGSQNLSIEQIRAWINEHR